jgi:hypothetical protein
MAARIMQNGADVWQFLALILDEFRRRVDVEVSVLVLGQAISDDELLTLVKDCVFPTALVSSLTRSEAAKY